MHHRPLILKGGAKTGKTWTLNEFGRLFYEDVLYIDCSKRSYMSYLVESKTEARRVISKLSAYHGEDIIPGKTLIIFDEVQTVCGLVHMILKLFKELPEYHVCMTGFHVERELPAYDDDIVNPYILEMRPMNFKEFMSVSGNEDLIRLITEDGRINDESDRKRIRGILKDYFMVGGYPNVVNTWIGTGDINKVREAQRYIINEVLSELAVDYQEVSDEKLDVLKLVSDVLKKENKKFLIQTPKDEDRILQKIDELQSVGFVHKVSRVSEGKWPPERYLDDSSYKLYLSDVGILSCLYGPEVDKLEADECFSVYNGALTEQFVFQELRSHNPGTLVYWTSQKPPAKADFLFHDVRRMVPIEISRINKRHTNGLSIYSKKYDVPIGIRISFDDFSKDSCILTIPIYAIWNL